MDTQTEDEARELYDEAQGRAGFPTSGEQPRWATTTRELIEDAQKAASEGKLMYIDPNALLAAFGFPPVEASQKEEQGTGGSPEEQGREQEGTEEPGAPDQTKEPGDDRTRQPEEPDQGPTSQPGPATEPTGPSSTPSHPGGAPEAP